ncbi:hypothetical protein [Caldinitratiruptor microaerophilus]|nr:hypothetical protein [Caldinitratiruptor microaerophilus]
MAARVGLAPTWAWLALSLAIAVGGLPGRAAASQPALVSVTAGWDGQATHGTWTPVRVRLRGGDQDLQVAVEAVLQNEWQTPTGTTRFPVASYGREEALPAGVEKDVVLWVPVSGHVGAEVRVSAGEQVLDRRQVTFQFGRAPGWPLVGVLAAGDAVASGIQKVEIPLQGLPVPIGVARVAAAEIPDEPSRMDALTAIVVHGDAGAGLSDSQREALRGWVRSGGELVLLGGPSAAQSLRALPEGTLPLRLDGVETVRDLGALAAWGGSPAPAGEPAPVAVLRPAGGVVLAGPTERPLAWRFALGSGGVTVLAADPSLAPLRAWDGLGALWKKVLEPVLPVGEQPEKFGFPRWRGQTGPAENVLYAAETLPPEAFPDWRTIAFILGGFALVAGPLVHWLLSRLDRREWTWVAVPALSLAVAGGLYGFGFGVEQRDVIRSVVSRVRLDPAGGGEQNLVLGVFSPTRRDIEVAVPGDLALRVAGGGPEGPAGPYGPWGPVGPESFPTDPPYRVLAGRRTRVLFRGGEWGMRRIQFERTLGPEIGRIEARLGLDGGAVAGTLRNATPYPLEDVLVVLGPAFHKIGDLAPGEEAQVRLEPPAGVARFQGGPGLGWRAYARLKNPPPKPPQPGIPLDVWQLYDPPPQDPRIQQRMRILDMLAQRPTPGPAEASLPLTVFAFTRSPVGQVDFEPAGHPTYHLNLLEQPLTLTLPPGPFRLPPGLVTSELAGMTSPGWGGGSSGQISWMEIESGTIDLAYRPPLPPGARVEALTITTRQMNLQQPPFAPGKVPPPGPPAAAQGPQAEAAQAGVFSLYNWRAGTWDPLPGGREEVRVVPAAAYVGPDHEVRVRVTAVQGRTAFVVPDVTFEGRVGG